MAASASKSALLLSPCIRWAWEGAKAYEDEFANTDKRDKGTEFHRLMDTYYAHGELRMLQERLKFTEPINWACLAVEWSRRHLEPRCAEIHSEQYVSTLFLGDGGVHVDASVRDRKYPKLGKGWLPGTTDLACVLHDGRLLVADWKTGGGTGADKQLLTLALGLRQVHRRPDGSLRPVTLAVLYATPDGVHPHEWVVTDDQLEQHMMAMHLQLLDVGVRKEPSPGIHCTQLYCPHLAYCPGISAVVGEAAEVNPNASMAAQLLPAANLVRRYSIQESPSCDQHAGSIMERVTAAERQLEFYKKRVRKYCEDGGRAIAGEFEYSKKADGFRWRAMK